MLPALRRAGRWPRTPEVPARLAYSTVEFPGLIPPQCRAMNSTRIAFLGLGIMGTGMARRLMGAGFSLAVYNRNRARGEPLAAEGARIADTPRAAAEGADVVISMVADDVASRAVWLGADGALAGAKRGALGIDCSTLTVAWVAELARAAAAAGVELVDAPVTGSKGPAASGELNFLVGASPSGFERARPVLQPMSRSITHLGPVGSGAFVKLVNNFLSGVQVAAFAEALAWIERGPVDPAKALAVITEGAPGSPIVRLMQARMVPQDYAPNFLLRLMAKDLAYAVEESGRAGQTLVTAAAALERFQAAIAAGHGERDMAAVVEPLRARPQS